MRPAKEASHISIDAIYKSDGEIPESLLLGCGVPDSIIAQIPALVGALQPIQFLFLLHKLQHQGRGICQATA
jgi:hypothetical protein